MGISRFTPNFKKGTGKKFNNKPFRHLYDSKAWVHYRAKYLSYNPKCYVCGQPATVVDHLTPHKGDEKLFKNLENHIPLCFSHHNTVTTKFDRDYKPGNTIVPKLTWLARERSRAGQTFPVRVLPQYDNW